MLIDLLFDPFGASWADLRDGATAAEDAGLHGVWTFDHLAGSIHGAPRVVECWTILTALAVHAPRLSIGSLVLNVANRDPALVGVMAATLQEVSAGRLLLGIGAGGGADTPYAEEQRAVGREVAGDVHRRAAVVSCIETIRQVWTGELNGVGGFLRPDPAPPIVVGGFGEKMAQLAGAHADGINLPLGPNSARLLEIARDEHARSSRGGTEFVVTVSSSASERELEAARSLGAERAIIRLRPPFTPEILRLSQLDLDGLR